MPGTAKLYIPMILETGRRAWTAGQVADFILGELKKYEGIETELIEIGKVFSPLPTGEISASANYFAILNRADAVLIIKSVFDSERLRIFKKSGGDLTVYSDQAELFVEDIAETELSLLDNIGLMAAFWNEIFQPSIEFYAKPKSDIVGFIEDRNGREYL